MQNALLTYKFKSGSSLLLRLSVLQLNFRRPFRTAHASSLTRSNLLITLHLRTLGRQGRGAGQAGLPPKLKGCYESNLKDCYQFFELLDQRIKVLQDIDLETAKQLIKSLKPQHKSPASAFINAFFQAYCQLQGSSVSRELGSLDVMQSYVTVSIGSLEQVKQQTEWALTYSQLIKVKINQDLELLQKILQYLNENTSVRKIILDANASWSNSFSLLLLQRLLAFPKVWMIEQPFPIAFDVKEWETVFELYSKAGIKIYADQSFRDQKDINKIKKVVHGVNIKLQKCAGIFNAISSIQAARANNLEVMVGIMITSEIGCSHSASLSGLADCLDIDGVLLANSQAEKRLEWKQQKIRLIDHNSY